MFTVMEIHPWYIKRAKPAGFKSICSVITFCKKQILCIFKHAHKYVERVWKDMHKLLIEVNLSIANEWFYTEHVLPPRLEITTKLCQPWPVGLSYLAHHPVTKRLWV